MRLAFCPQSTIFLVVGTMQATRTRVHTGNSNQFMDMVELPKGAIVELELSIDKKANEYSIESAELV